LWVVGCGLWVVGGCDRACVLRAHQGHAVHDARCKMHVAKAIKFTRDTKQSDPDWTDTIVL